MAVFNEPTKWAQTLGKDADVVSIPDTAGETDPSIDKIFPSVFSIPLAQGGRAIPRSVLNGLFKLVGDWLFYIQNGGIPTYKSSYDYVKGRIVLHTDNNIYLCIQNNNSSDPKPPTNSAYWSKLLSISDLSGYVTNPVNYDLNFNNALRILRNDNDKYLIFVAGADSSTSSSILINGINRIDGSIQIKAKDSNSNTNNISINADGTIIWNSNNLKTVMANCAMPSLAYDSLTVGASGTTYTASADGYAFASGTVDVNSLWSFVELSSSTGVSSRCLATTGSLGMKVFIPLRKGQRFNFNYQNANNLTLTFKYAVGSESEQ